jgi:hypothetical protein
VHALFRAAVGKGRFDRGATGFLHQGVVADLVRGFQAGLDVPGFDPVLGERGPDTGIAVGLKFELDRQRVGFAGLRSWAVRTLSDVPSRFCTWCPNSCAIT